jgi:sugar/nucleoside kinase (ribokinase family)
MFRSVRGLNPESQQPTAFGMGLLALDVVMTSRAQRYPRWFAGGTCGNVLAALSYLGWRTAPISRLGPDAAADRIIEDLQRWNVSTGLISRPADGSTPVIIHRIGTTKNGEPYHSFSWRCPACGSHLPGYKPVLASVAHQLAEQCDRTDVFFFDRVSRGVLLLAEHYKSRGAIVMFEPCGVSDPNLFRQAWRLSHIVKYSHERLRDITDVALEHKEQVGVLLEIETLGINGLRYRSRLPRAETNGWQKMAAFPVAALRDSAGAGDWCSAGILCRIGRRGLASMKQVSAPTIRDSLRYGQALAAWNCGFEGARGGMYEVSKEAFRKDVQRILNGSDRPVSPDVDFDSAMTDLIGEFCPSCNEANVSRSSTAGRRLQA